MVSNGFRTASARRALPDPLLVVALLISVACSSSEQGGPPGADDSGNGGTSSGTSGTAGSGGASTGGTSTGGSSAANGGAAATTTMGGAGGSGVSGASGAGASGFAGDGTGGAGGSGGAGSAGSPGGGSGGVADAGAGGAGQAGGGAGGKSGGGVGGQAGDGAAGKGGAGSGGSAGSTYPNGCPIKLEGWATVNASGSNGTTGGGNAAPTTVTTFAELRAAAQDSQPRVIVVRGTIRTTDGGGSAMSIASNKTILGADKNATLYGGITMSNVQNIILRNLNIQGTYPNSGPDDTVASHTSHHIWYDHLNIWDSTDGSLDITNASNYQTVSWSKFWYTSSSHPHRLASLNGSGGGDHPEDWGNNKVTYHHNWWSTNVNERMPRVMYGLGHQYNNFFNSPGNGYCIGVGSYGAILVENNYFKGVKDPHVFMYDVYMDITARGNVYDGTTGTRNTGRGGTRAVDGQNFTVAPFTSAPYSYAMDATADVPTIVQRCAGPQ